MVMAFAPVPAVCIFGLLFLKGSLLRGRNVWVDGFLSLSTLLLGSICCYLFVAWLGRTTWRPFILLALRETGYPVCVRCGYSMQGLDQQTLKCPECGADRDGHVAVD